MGVQRVAYISTRSIMIDWLWVGLGGWGGRGVKPRGECSRLTPENEMDK